MKNKTYGFGWIWKKSSRIWWLRLLQIIIAVLTGIVAILITNVIC